MSAIDPLKWSLEFSIADGGSGLKKAASQLTDVEKKVDKIADTANTKAVPAFNNLSKAFSDLSGSSGSIGKLAGALTGGGGIGSILKSLSLEIGFATVAIYGLSKAFSALDEFSDKASEAFSERTNALRVYTTILGDAKKAQEEFNFVSALGQKTEFTREQIEKVSRKLVVSGFKDTAERQKAELTIADIASATPLDQRETNTGRLSLAFSKIKGNNYLQQGDLKQFTGLLGRQGIKEELATALGTNLKGVDDKIRDKKIDADTAIAAIQRATLKQFGTSKLGEFATGAADDITTLISNQQEGEKNALLAIEPEKLASFEAFKDSIKQLTELMDSSTEDGKNYKYVLETISEIGMAIKTFINDFKAGFMEGFGEVFKAVREFLSVGDDATDVQSGIRALGTAFKWVGIILGGLVGFIAGVFIKAWDLVIGVAQRVSEGFRFMGAALKDVGSYISDKTLDIYDGLKSIFEGLYLMIKGVIGLSFTTIKEGFNKLSSTSFSTRTEGKSYDTNVDALIVTLGKEKQDALAKAKADALKAKSDKNIEDNKASSGSGGGGKDKSGFAVDFNAYKGPIGDLGAYLRSVGISTPKIPGTSLVPHSVNGPERIPTVKPQIFIDNFIQNIEADGSSPKEVAQEAYTRFTQEIGRRIVRSPSPLVT